MNILVSYMPIAESSVSDGHKQVHLIMEISPLFKLFLIQKQSTKFNLKWQHNFELGT
jgi:hypothetical protein